jgi:ATP/maltotriose-dependent transcriptional regulator MalT
MSALLGRLPVGCLAGPAVRGSPSQPRLPGRAVARLGQTDARAPRRGAAAGPPGLAEPLTGRELEVLRLIAAGRSNLRIARDLVVSFDTAKSI